MNRFVKSLQTLLAVGFLLSGTSWADEEVVHLLLTQNRLTEALPICRQYEVLNGGNGKGMVDCAWVYYRTGRSDAAELIRAKLTDSKYSQEVQLLNVYANIKKRRFNQARDLLNRLEGEFKGTPYSSRVQQLFAEMYEEQGRIDTAAFIYKQLVADQPKNGWAHWGLARHHLNRRENAKATVHLTQTAIRWPQHMASRFNLAVLYLNQENLVEAGRWLAECYRLDRSDAGVLEQLGILFEKKSQFGDAIKYWQKALDLNTKSEIAKVKLRKYYGELIDRAIEEEEYPKAAMYLENALKVGNTDKRNFLRRGVVLRYKREFEKAAGELLAYLNLFPKDPLGLRELGICYLNMSLFDEAQKYFEKAMQADPSEGLTYAWFAWLMESRGKICEARRSWARAVQLIKVPTELRKATRKLASIERRARGICQK